MGERERERVILQFLPAKLHDLVLLEVGISGEVELRSQSHRDTRSRLLGKSSG